MEECIEVSSDSSDTIILSPDYASAKNVSPRKDKDFYQLSSSDDETQDSKQNKKYDPECSDDKNIDCDGILQRLLKKYSQNSSQEAVGYSTSTSSETTDGSCKRTNNKKAASGKLDDDDGKETSIFELNCESVQVGATPKQPVDEALENLYEKYYSKSFNNQNEATTSNNQPCNSENEEKSDSVDEDLIPETTKSKGGKQNKKRKQELEDQRTLKRLQKEKQKELKEQEKALKNVMRTIQKNNSKDGCIKTIVVQVENSLLQQEFASYIITVLQEHNIPFKGFDSFSNHITWLRKSQTLENMVLKETECHESHHLVILPLKMFTKHIKEKNLLSHIQELHVRTNFAHLTVVIFGSNGPKDYVQESAMLEVEMSHKCLWHFPKTEEDLANFILTVTKSVAQIPYKQEQQEKYQQQNLYFKDSNRDTVRVDKNGNGLGRLWHQMLTMFPLARLEHAEAITAVYPTPKTLFQVTISIWSYFYLLF
nr:unnamed protein product [Callosobruchus chinensis]